MKGGMVVVGERDCAAAERVMRRDLGVAVAGGRSSAEDFMVLRNVVEIYRCRSTRLQRLLLKMNS